MKDNPVAWLNRLIDKGRILLVEGMDLRTPEAGIEWQGRADQFRQEAKAGVADRSPDDAARLETLSPYLPVALPPGHPWWTPPPALFIASCTSSALCEANQPVSYHLALINRLEKIVSDWRVKEPVPPIAAARRGRPGHDRPLTERAVGWMLKMKKHSNQTKRAVAEDISAEEGVAPETVLREASRARTGR